MDKSRLVDVVQKRKTLSNMLYTYEDDKLLAFGVSFESVRAYEAATKVIEAVIEEL